MSSLLLSFHHLGYRPLNAGERQSFPQRYKDLQSPPIGNPRPNRFLGFFRERIIEVDHRIYSVVFPRTPELEDLTVILYHPDTVIRTVAVGWWMQQLLEDTDPVSGNLWSTVRLRRYWSEDRFPALKLSLAPFAQLTGGIRDWADWVTDVLRREYELLLRMQEIPVVTRVFRLPLFDDNNRFCGFRMQYLRPIPFITQQDTRRFPRMWMARIAEALHVLHNAGFVHGNLHAECIMRDEADRVVFTDFAMGGREGDRVVYRPELGGHDEGNNILDRKQDLDRYQWL